MAQWKSSVAPAAEDWNDGAVGASKTDFGDVNGGFGNGFDSQDGGEFGQVARDDTGCRNCGEDGHFARECPQPRRGGGACFNCGEEGHNKVDCTAPRKPSGPCRVCNQEGHFADACTNRKCRNCQQEGHDAHECKNPKIVDNVHVAEKTEHEAWVLLEQASEERDIGDFKDALQILAKVAPACTYPNLEKEFRKRGFGIFLIAMEKDHGDTWTNVNLQGEIGKKYAVSYFTSDKPQRPTLIPKWPKDAEDNLARLADAGVPLDRGVDKCNNCGEIGHKSRACTQDRVASEQPTVYCHQCNEEGHRVRDCTQERKQSVRACKICESEEHLAKDCPDRVVKACHNCGETDHMSKDCTAERKIICNNCDQEGHMWKDCTQPRKKIDWANFTCPVCKQKGHGRKRCPEATAEGEENVGGGGDFSNTEVNGGFDDGAGWQADKPSTNSAPAEWEKTDNLATAPALVSAGNGW